MMLYSSPDCCASHRVRIVLAEKDLDVDIIDVDAHSGRPPEDLLHLNPYSSLPTLVDRELVLYDSRVIIEYLDERFPHPPLLPQDPADRARFRLALSQIENDWYSLLGQLDALRAKAQTEAYNKIRKQLTESLMNTTALFNSKTFFMSEVFSLLDCSLAPLLWRLPHYGVELLPQAQVIVDYSQRLFARPAFQKSLSTIEHDFK